MDEGIGQHNKECAGILRLDPRAQLVHMREIGLLAGEIAAGVADHGLDRFGRCGGHRSGRMPEQCLLSLLSVVRRQPEGSDAVSVPADRREPRNRLEQVMEALALHKAPAGS